VSLDIMYTPTKDPPKWVRSSLYLHAGTHLAKLITFDHNPLPAQCAESKLSPALCQKGHLVVILSISTVTSVPNAQTTFQCFTEFYLYQFAIHASKIR